MDKPILHINKRAAVYTRKSGNALYVSFPVDLLTIDKMKRLPKRIYHPSKQEWEIPIRDVSYFLKEFGDYPMTSESMEESKDIIERVKAYKKGREGFTAQIDDGFSFKTDPFPHQNSAFMFGQEHPKFLLADDQGLGKTFSAINLAISRQSQMKHCLIICGVNGLKWNWEGEIETHSNATKKVLGVYTNTKGRRVQGSVKKRLEDLDTIDEFFIITNKETLLNKDIQAKLKEMCDSGEIGMIVIDEFHKLKNSQSKVGKAIHKLNSYYKVALTGTPLMNNPIDLYNLLKWLDVEYRSLTAFKNDYCIFVAGAFGGEIQGFKNMPQLQENLARVQLRRRKEEVLDLPEKIRTTNYVELTTEQEKLYKDIKNDLLSEINEIVLLPNPLAKLIRLRQVTGCPQILDPEMGLGAKMERLVEIVGELKAQNHKFIIFSNWKETLRIVERELVKKGITYTVVDGDTKDEDKMSNVRRFQDDPSVLGLIGTTGALGTGFTANKAEYVIFLDSPWNEANKRQAEDRAHRIGTKNTVNVITLVSQGTIDDKIEQLIEVKKDMSEYLIDGKGTTNWKQLVVELLK